MQSFTAVPTFDAPGGIESVITTDELSRRPNRPADFAAENQVLQKLASTMAEEPKRVLQELVDSARQLCRAGSAGISLLDPELSGPAAQFRWVATAGEFSRYAGNTMPRHFSPCGSVLDANRMLMMKDPVRHFPYIEVLSHSVDEVLLVPFYQGSKPVGTVWVAHHSPDRQFDSEDARVVTSLSKFAAAAVQVLATVDSKRKLEEDARLSTERNLAALAVELKDTQRLRDVAARLIGGDDPSALFDEILLAALEITEADAGTLQLLEPASKTLFFLAKRGFSQEITDHFARVDASSDSPCGIALSSGSRAFIDFAANAPVGSSDQWHFDEGMRCAQSTPLLSRSGRPLGMFSTHWRTQRTLSEREIRFLDLLGRQAADLIERAQAQDALREADRRKDEFLAVLAHELRNPLVPIRTGVELLSRAAQQPALIEKIRPMMERQVAHVVRLIDDLLDVSRITSGKIELQRQKVTLASVIDSAVEANRSAIATAGLELALNVETPEGLIEVDPTRLSQVIANILHNATKFTPRGGVVTLDARVRVTGDAAELVLKVTDTGVGIDPKQLSRIFGLFAQVHGDSSNRLGGLGIGLALSQKLAELHGGSVTAESAGLGTGCKFTVRIPTPDLLTEHDSASVKITPALQGPRVLIVDDNRDAADATGMLMTNLGGDVRVVYDGTSALQLLQEFDAKLVLLDLGMPGMDGYQLCRRIRDSKGTGVSIVAITGWGQEEDRRRTIEAGFDAHLTKPVDLRALAAVARSMNM
ncbi:hybrid sensor histidine kinase/response regulator [Steroidobacter sp.]|uniref:hybrid sensor histidine kinase/response regulator n=1 Tax=Steroidobacter sp. TaxID=1978227 RepID=UPI001A60CC44|nr:hybrid sensor histidine kinase/response regulator [Steroidobacter sp.]MBL8271892.1 response regulator [Steroidobacter sp.]